MSVDILCLMFFCKTGEDEETRKARQKLALEEGTSSEANAEMNDSTNAIGQQQIPDFLLFE